MRKPSRRPDQALKRQLAKLAKSPIAALRLDWRAVFKIEPPPAFGRDLLRRVLTQRLQESHHGGLPVAARRELARLARSRAGPANTKVPRRIKPGSVLLREWQGVSHRVTVLTHGFEYAGRPHDSLSQIARLITGTRWNGPRFFGLRSKAGVEQ